MSPAAARAIAGSSAPRPRAGAASLPPLAGESLKAAAPLAGVRHRRAARIAILLLLGSMGVTGAGLFHIWVRLRMLQYEADLGIETRAHVELIETNRRLRTEAAWLRRPEAIEAVARDRLGMVSPDPASLRVLSPRAAALPPERP